LDAGDGAMEDGGIGVGVGGEERWRWTLVTEQRNAEETAAWV
jgi:hypothetical protein